MKGFGTVVTGTVIGGTVATGKEVAILPGGIVAKVRGLQVHGGPVERSSAGTRTAVNLQGMEKRTPRAVRSLPSRNVLPDEVRGSLRRIPSAGPQAAAQPGPDHLPRGDLLLRREDPPLRPDRNSPGKLGVRAGAALRADGPLGWRPVDPAGILPAGEFGYTIGGGVVLHPKPPAEGGPGRRFRRRFPGCGLETPRSASWPPRKMPAPSASHSRRRRSSPELGRSEPGES